jgi:addiction module HigA family antidote
MLNIQNPMHPGEFIRKAYLDQMDIQITTFAEKLGVDNSTASRLVNKKADVSYEMAIRLSKVLGRSPESWMTMQMAYSLPIAAERVDVEKLGIIYEPKILNQLQATEDGDDEDEDDTYVRVDASVFHKL